MPTDVSIEDLTKRVLDAAKGKPAKISITRQRSKQAVMGQVIRRMLLSQLQAGQTVSGSQSTNGVSQGNGSSARPAAGVEKSDRMFSDEDISRFLALQEESMKKKGASSEQS